MGNLRDARQEPVLKSHDLIPDGALPDSADDDLDHEAIARVLAELSMDVTTPANIALFGPWGSGKSSVYGMLREHVATINNERRRPSSNLSGGSRHAVLVRYDAWKFGGHSLQRNFLTAVANEPQLRRKHLDNLYAATETTRLRLGTFLRKNWVSLLVALGLAVGVTVVWSLGIGWVDWVRGTNGVPQSYRAEVLEALRAGTLVFGAVLAGLLLSNQSLASVVEKRTRAVMSDADQFSRAFDKLMAVVTQRRWWVRALDKIARFLSGNRWPYSRTDRLIVFVDELDRCRPAEVATTLTDLLTFLDHEDCVFIVAADREALEAGIEEAPQAKPVRENEPYYSTSGAFLDKVFQHQISLPPTRAEALTVFAKGLVEEQGGIWAELRADQAVFEDVIYALVPAHVRSPRRVKILLNNFATSARVMQARNLDWRSQAVSIAVLTVLQTEFPAVVDDCVQHPRLLEALIGQVESPSPELDRAAHSYAIDDDTKTNEGKDRKPRAASPLLVTGGQPPSVLDRERARQRLNRQLHDYLGRIHVANIALPTLDLVYLQVAGHAEGIDDPDLARALDIAADVEPETTLTAIREYVDIDAPVIYGPAPDMTMPDDSTKVAIINYLVAQVPNRFGQLRANLVEVAAQVAETLSPAAANQIARRAASEILREGRSGRWRTRATPGAIRLGLLDTEITQPLDFLADTGELEAVADNGYLHKLVAYLPTMPLNRAEMLFDYLGNAYEQHPEPFEHALGLLPPQYAQTLWEQQEETLRTYFDAAPALPAQTPSSAPATATRPASTEQTQDDQPDPALEALTERSDRYRRLLEAVIGRSESDLDELHALRSLAITMLTFGMCDDPLADQAADHEAIVSLYDRATAWADTGWLADNTFNSLHRAHLVLRGIREATTVSDIIEWAPSLRADYCLVPRADESDVAAPMVEEHTQAAARIVSALSDPLDDMQRCQSAFGTIVHRVPSHSMTFFTGQLLDQIRKILEVQRPSEAATRVRSQQLDLLGELELASESLVSTSGVLLDTLLKALDAATPDNDDVPSYITSLARLDPGDAATFADSDALTTLRKSAPIVGLRLAIAARERAGRQALPGKDITPHIANDNPSASLLREWFDSHPTAANLVNAIRCRPRALPAAHLGRWSKNHNTSDRSKVWISLEKAGRAENTLESVGQHGVNGTVVEHMRPQILDAPLTKQDPAVRRLITANTIHDTPARRQAQEIAVHLLATKIAGAGRNAAKLIIAAGGAAPGAKNSLRDAIDTFMKDVPNHSIPHRDLDRLNELGLFKKRKKHPLAKRFDWFK